MEKEIRDRMHDGILSAARARYGIAADAIRLLDGFESFMYEFDKEGAAYILRLGHSRRRSPDLIRGEVDWINYLAAGGAGVARAVLSANGRLVEEIPDDGDGAFLATAFVKAPGGPLWQMGGWTDDLLVRYGRLLGRIHALSKSYAPGNPAWRRGTWRDRNNLGLEAILPPGETRVLARYTALMDHLLALPETAAGYGMIHQDAHGGNFFVDAQGEITLFDFDDCVYGHYVYDLAMVLFYAVTNRDDAAEFGPHFWRHFMTGYTQETDIDAAWLAEVPHFMKLREIDLYAITMRDFADPPADSWVGRFLHNRQARIEAGVPYLEMDFVNWQRAGAAAAAPAPTLVEVGGAARQGLEPLFAPLEAYLTPTFVLRQGELGRAFAGGGTAVCWSGHRVY
ncbi:MAG: phosphotransferase, partial [Anaerolineales bacterium]|nr:phosphotransferase [Anaerolineales bacterium]